MITQQGNSCSVGQALPSGIAYRKWHSSLYFEQILIVNAPKITFLWKNTRDILYIKWRYSVCQMFKPSNIFYCKTIKISDVINKQTKTSLDLPSVCCIFVILCIKNKFFFSILDAVAWDIIILPWQSVSILNPWIEYRKWRLALIEGVQTLGEMEKKNLRLYNYATNWLRIQKK